MRVAIAHAPLANRVPTLERLLSQLAPQGVPVHVSRSRRMEHAAVWAYRLWEWAESTDDDCILLNDDVEVSPDLVAACSAICELPTSPIVSLHTSVPQAKEIANRGGCWARVYWQTGPAYLFKRGAAKPLLDYVASLPWKFRASYNEDNVSQHFAWEKQEPFHSTIPALVRHDTDVPSSLAYDDHPLRTSCVPWTDFADKPLGSPDYWRVGIGAPPYVKNPWFPEPYMEAIRRGLKLNHQCNICWQNESVARHHDLDVCPKCIAALSNTALHAMLVQ